MKSLDPESEEFERHVAWRFKDHVPPDRYSDTLKREDEETEEMARRGAAFREETRCIREAQERRRASDERAFGLKASGLVIFAGAIVIVPTVVVVCALTGAVVIGLKIALGLVLVKLVLLVFRAAFGAARAPFALVNLLTTAASGSASAWRFIRDLLR